MTSLHIAKLWRDSGLPPDVFQVVLGGAEVGEALIGAVDMVFFTGSPATGRKVARAAAERLIPAALEMGGKSAMIVLADADVPRAAHAAVWSSFAHSGQVCVRTERVLVEAPVADEFTRLCQAEIEKLRQGPALLGDGDVDVGAMTFPPQIEHVERQIAQAIGAGAKRLTGGPRPHAGGQFLAPTLLADVTPDMAVAREETFGPVLPVLRVRDAEHALAVANDSPLGLSGSVWSRDKSRALALARRLESGSVCVNDTLVNYFCVEAPLGGVKGSGMGLRHGPEGLRQFCRIETIIEDHPLLGLVSPFVGRQISFPYKGVVLRAIRWLMQRIY